MHNENEINNLELWEKVAEVPKEALKKIEAGRLKGFSDINPTWRIKELTRNFGIVGFGWYYKVISIEKEPGVDGEILIFATIELFIKKSNEWSMPIVGTGGSTLIAKEKNGLRASDECKKMAITDALSVCCKLLGIGANVYYANDPDSKYNKEEPTNDNVKRKVIGNYLISKFGKENASSELEKLTSFEKDGKNIKGVNSLKDLNGIRLNIAYAKVKEIKKNGEGE